MTEILEPGSGKSSLHGGTPAIIMDAEEHWLYGWTRYEAAKAKGDNHLFAVIRRINLAIYIAYIEARFPQWAHLTKPLFDTNMIRFEDLLAIDRAINLTEFHASELETLQNRYDSGQMLDNDGNPVLPMNFVAQE